MSPLEAVTHTFLERSEPVPAVITYIIKERIKKIDKKTTSFRVFTSNNILMEFELFLLLASNLTLSR